MRANILLIDYEHRSVDRVRRALAETEHPLEIAGDLQKAVEICAHFEPRLVIITAELPGVSVDDAITQLRARAGLRATPFLIMMAGYHGTGSEDDAARLGAQDILPRPYSSEALVEKVERLVRLEVGGPAAQAIPPETQDALRRSVAGGGASLTSQDLFGDILSDVEGEEPKKGAPPAAAPKAGKRGGDEALAEALGTASDKASVPRKPSSAERDVDKMLSENRVVNAGLNTSREKRLLQGVPLRRSDRVDMVDMAGIGHFLRRLDVASRQEFVIALSMLTTRVSGIASYPYADGSANLDLRVFLFTLGGSAGYRQVYRNHTFAPGADSSRDVRNDREKDGDFDSQGHAYGEGRLRFVVPLDPFFLVSTSTVRWEGVDDNSFDWFHANMHDGSPGPQGSSSRDCAVPTLHESVLHRPKEA